MAVRIFTYELILAMPTIVTSVTGFRGMCYTTVSNYIPGSMVRGALMTKLLEERLLERSEVENEALNPMHSVSPALCTPPQLSRAVPYRDLAFAHALSFVFKGEDRVLSLGIEKLMLLAEKRGVESALRELLLDAMLRIDERAYGSISRDPSQIFRCSAEMKIAAHEPLARINGMWRIVKPGRGVYVENAVDRARESAMHGALYAYEYIEPGSRFVGFIAIHERSLLSKALDSLKDSYVDARIGRGLGRGFGLARLRISEARLEDFEIVIEDVRKKIVLYAYAPTTHPDEPFHPPRVGDSLVLRVFGAPAARARILALLGRGVMRYGGWSYRTGTPKMPIRALQPGSLIIAELEGIENRELLAYVPFAGIDPLSAQGFNIVAPLQRDFLPLVS